MPTPVTVYRWDDEGAPQITQQYGSANDIKTVLDACLVDGYGAKQPLGWSRVFDSSEGVVYRNDVTAGSGGMIKFWPRSGNWFESLGSSSTTSMGFQAAKQFINITTPYHAGYEQSFYHPARSVTKAWVIIGTSTAFYLIMGYVDPTKSEPFSGYKMQSGSNVYNLTLFCGDIISTLENDAGKFTALCDPKERDSTTAGNLQTLDSLSNPLDANISYTYMRLYSADNSDTATSYALRNALPNLTSLSFQWDNPGTLSPIYITRSPIAGAGVLDLTPNEPWFRGILPGFYNSLMGSGGSEVYWPMTTKLAGQFYWLVRSSSGLSHLWINMEEW
ncbi:hypothetical protein [Pseudoalteromonas piscicida]|uniref:Uncharacterized protein n=1 Tax=Pseudoalteromonas piscicida TaxID=43662 RepID=A0AAD0RH25_PSEO7|nr:hypothetical protein [Pseudoalteromonas piscicida]ASD67724.1 hypothetical protein B1L02_12300 [Pseudoalteromonas piscicida]AXR01573.1 hypothetical protein D0511_05430 [Pseudoalteromonas piscicida]